MKLMKCDKCGYTLNAVCKCGKTKSAHPPKFSERYGKYRRMAKKQD
ncbi:MAG: nucleolar RNA-binding Nop10p family protein [Candidatus Aenigmatarchaeota archaeon]|nr:nucleolar RNA-binding Nop10p family protein [archaeon]